MVNLDKERWCTLFWWQSRGILRILGVLERTPEESSVWVEHTVRQCRQRVWARKMIHTLVILPISNLFGVFRSSLSHSLSLANLL